MTKCDLVYPESYVKNHMRIEIRDSEEEDMS